MEGKGLCRRHVDDPTGTLFKDETVSDDACEIALRVALEERSQGHQILKETSYCI